MAHGPSNGWYNSWRWRRMRIRQLRDHPLCCLCLQDHRIVPATVADHIVPHRNNYELFWHGALQSLCQHHHSSTKQQQERKGYTDDIGEDGWPVDPEHPHNRTRARRDKNTMP